VFLVILHDRVDGLPIWSHLPHELGTVLALTLEWGL
jgi:hypothetical protein